MGEIIRFTGRIAEVVLSTDEIMSLLQMYEIDS